jgi:hypothetical protein
VGLGRGRGRGRKGVTVHVRKNVGGRIIQIMLVVGFE